MSTDATCRNQTNTFDATVRLESLDAHISAIEKRLVFNAYFHLNGAGLIHFHYSIDCLFDFGSKVASLQYLLDASSPPSNTVYKQDKDIFKF